MKQSEIVALSYQTHGVLDTDIHRRYSFKYIQIVEYKFIVSYDIK